MKKKILCLALAGWAFLSGCKENPHIAVHFEGSTPLSSSIDADAEQDADKKKEILASTAVQRVKMLDKRRVYLECSGCGRSKFSKPPLAISMEWKFCRSENCQASGRLYERVPTFKCPYCHATGVCPTCRQWGRDQGPKKGRCYNCDEIASLSGEKKSYVVGHTQDWRVPTVCRNCDGTNLCPVCKGTALCDFCGGDGELTEEEIKNKIDAQEGKTEGGEEGQDAEKKE